MKTKLIQQGLTKKFSEDVLSLVAIPADALHDIAVAMEAAIRENEESVDENLLPVAAKHDVVLDDLLKAVSVAQFLLANERDSGDSIEAVAEDLVATNKFSREQADQVVVKIRDCASALGATLQDVLDRVSDLSMTFPTLEHIHTRCSAAIRFDQEHNSSKDYSDTYIPRITRMTPVAVVQMDIDKYGETETFVVGLSSSELVDLIAHLQFAQKQLNQVSKTFETKE